MTSPARKSLVACLTLLVATVGLTAVVFAVNPHFVTGPTITTSAGVATVCGKIAGLGNNQLIRVEFSATATTTCTNKGGNVPPGQTEILTGSGTFRTAKNGSVSFCVSTARATNPCPKPMTPQTTFTDFSVRVFDAAGNQIIP